MATTTTVNSDHIKKLAELPQMRRARCLALLDSFYIERHFTLEEFIHAFRRSEDAALWPLATLETAASDLAACGLIRISAAFGHISMELAAPLEVVCPLIEGEGVASQ